jgi:hypothetical protein
MHGTFPKLRELLELKLIDERDFICEGWGCIYNPLTDFTYGEHGEFVLEEDFPSNECEFFEPRRNKEELAKNIYLRKYTTQKFIDSGKKVKHLNIARIPQTCKPRIPWPKMFEFPRAQKPADRFETLLERVKVKDGRTIALRQPLLDAMRKQKIIEKDSVR